MLRVTGREKPPYQHAVLLTALCVRAAYVFRLAPIPLVRVTDHFLLREGTAAAVHIPAIFHPGSTRLAPDQVADVRGELKRLLRARRFRV